jgi:hypothetical protein
VVISRAYGPKYDNFSYKNIREIETINLERIVHKAYHKATDTEPTYKNDYIVGFHEHKQFVVSSRDGDAHMLLAGMITDFCR